MEQLSKLKSALKHAKHVVISTHIMPDADGIGSQIALCLALKELGHKAIAVNEEPLLSRYNYLDPKNNVIGYKDYLKKFKGETIDLFIVVDTNNTNRIGHKMRDLVETSKKILYIDHHPCPKAVQALHCIDTTKAATGQIIGEFIQGLGLELTKEMALPLYTSIVIDTSSFRYPTVTGDTHKLIGHLLDTGISPNIAYNQIYGTKKVNYMQMLGEVLSTTKTASNQQIAWISLSQELLKKYNVNPEDTHSFINHLLILDNIKIACMFRSMGNKTKISFRSVGDYDVGEVAAALGGGGHNHSAATIIEGPIDHVIKDTISKIKKIISSP